MLKVEQSDRDAAAALRMKMRDGFVANIGEGFEDDTATVQAFAAYREEIIEKCATMADSFNDKWGSECCDVFNLGDHREGMADAAMIIASTIRGNETKK